MTREKYLSIKAKQIPNNEKIERCDFVINNHDEEATINNIGNIINELKRQVR